MTLGDDIDNENARIERNLNVRGMVAHYERGYYSRWPGGFIRLVI